jgi:hypothetical protein
VIAVGEESRDVVTGRCAVATAVALRQELTVFPSHHGGFMGGEFGYAGPSGRRSSHSSPGRGHLHVERHPSVTRRTR